MWDEHDEVFEREDGRDRIADIWGFDSALPSVLFPGRRKKPKKFFSKSRGWLNIGSGFSGKKLFASSKRKRNKKLSF